MKLALFLALLVAQAPQQPSEDHDDESNARVQKHVECEDDVGDDMCAIPAGDATTVNATTSFAAASNICCSACVRFASGSTCLFVFHCNVTC